MKTWTISGRIAIRGTVVDNDTTLTWTITSLSPPITFTYGAPGFIPLVGDWTGSGTEGIGVYQPSIGAFHLKYDVTNTDGKADKIIGFSDPNLTPLSWYDESGSPKYDGIGVINGSNVYLDKNLGGGATVINTALSDMTCPSPTIPPTVGQCVYIPPTHISRTISSRLGMTGTVVDNGITLTWTITSLSPPITFTYGIPGFIPLVGDWNGDGIEGIGAYDPSNGAFYLRQTATSNLADDLPPIGFGDKNLVPLSWYDGSGTLKSDKIGVVNLDAVYLNSDLNNQTAVINATLSDMVCPSPTTPPTVGQCTYTPPTHISRTVLGRIAITGTVVTEGTALRWDITAPPSSVGSFTYGASSFIPLVGDWKGIGIEGIGAYDPSSGRFHLKYDASAGSPNLIFIYRAPNLGPISWRDESGSLGHDAIGVIDGSNVYLNKNINGGTEEIVAAISNISCPLSTIVEQCLYAPPPPVSEAGGSSILIGALAIGTLAVMISKGKTTRQTK